MSNEALRAAIVSSGLGLEGTADGVGVDRKTVERWISGRTPYRRHQYALASLLGVDLRHLWPDCRPAEEVTAMGQAEVLGIYPHRSVVPPDRWTGMVRGARSRVDVLAFSAFWLSEDRSFHRLLEEKAASGVTVRVLLGDPDCAEVEQRGEDEGIGEAMASKVRNAIVNYGSLLTLEGIGFRLHRTTLYNSLYRADEEMLVNTHVYGVGAYLAPVLHLHHVPGADLFMTYVESFERIWDGARPLVQAVSGELATT
jgi:hypothetical protein